MALPLAMVVAVADNGVIGRDNRLIWRLRTDMLRFKRLTMGKPLLMGRRTFASIGKPLPGRETIVLTTDRAFAVPGVRVAHSFAQAIDIGNEVGAAIGADAIMVAGGAVVYAEALPLIQRLHLTLVHAQPEGDALFPHWARAAYRAGLTQSFREDHSKGEADEFAFSFIDLERQSHAPVVASH